jgi:hypothetical protein
VLAIFNLQSSRGVTLLLSLFNQSLAIASFFVFLDMGLPLVGGTYNLACSILTKVSKS